MKRGLAIAASGTAILAAALTGCGGDNAESSATSASSGESSSTAAGAGTSSGSGTSQVIIDGQKQEIAGNVVCTDVGGNKEIAIGDAATGQGLTVSITNADPPAVNRVVFGALGGGNLMYQQGVMGGNAEVEVDDKTYNVKGNAMSGMQQKPFEISVTCP
ncbi:lipoprotein LpqH [Mycobacterium sp. MYCO198283]|uniref:lipoprotein LpqH n=1 Tax=Mycobacterium sp. MYCO198283 TaxID=2883505 RepID=UPI001E55EF6C|nr:lipoprotein LpqH [Mycobacterium sp. MYCO198283]MCG5432909.1 lipoprotein LpqH [Mycobacterium sp. MYCO198283]